VPVTIGTLKSSVQVVDGDGALNDEATERIILMAVARMREELRSEIEAKKDADVSNKRVDTDPY
jgi:hypothetical protein